MWRWRQDFVDEHGAVLKGAGLQTGESPQLQTQEHAQQGYDHRLASDRGSKLTSLLLR